MAQKQVEQLGPDYDIEAGRDKNLLVKDRWGTISAATAKYPKYRERLGYVMTAAQADAKLMADTTITAAYLNAYYKWCMPLNNPVVGAMVNIEIPYGEFWVTQQLPKGPGRTFGSGTGYGGLSPGSTILSPYHEKWNGDPKFRSVLVGQNRGLTGNASYIESCTVDGIRFEGRAPQWYDPSFESYGYLAFQAGENNTAGRGLPIRADHFNDYGIGWAGATPGHFGDITAFKNNLGGVVSLGGALSTMSIDVLSGDDNPYLFRCIRGTQTGDGGDEGSMMDIGLIKLEGGTNTESELGSVHRGQMIGDVNGQGGVNIGTIQAATAYYLNHAMFRVNPFLPNYKSPQGMVVKVGLIKGVRSMPDGRPAFKRSFIDVANGRTWDAPQSFQPEYDLIYYNNPALALNYVKMSGRDIPFAAYAPKDRLGYIAHNDARNFDEAGGNPKFYFTGPPTWGTAPPVTPPTTPPTQPPVTPPVTPPTQPPVTPPATGEVIATVNNFSNTQAGYKQTVDWKAARKLEFTGLKATSLSSKSIVRNQAGDRVVIGPDGKIYVNIGGTERTVPNMTLQVNVAQNVVIELWAPVDFSRIGDSNFTSSSNNNAFVGSWQKLTVSK